MVSVDLRLGDALEVLKTIPDESISAVVTDPPYEIGFMNSRWDTRGIAFRPDLWTEVLRVMKPGAFLLSFGSPRTYHRMTCAIEDAGFEIKDCLMFLHGMGFPKGKSALKPAYEPITLARKPFRGTLAECVLAHGTGALNIDASRVGTESITTRGRSDALHKASQSLGTHWSGEVDTSPRIGRWPANVLLDEQAAAALDEASGESQSRATGYDWSDSGQDNPAHVIRNIKSGVHFGDTGGASRFFWTAKAGKTERIPKLYGRDLPKTLHPTVKPVDLMAYLVRLVCPPGGTVLDPFLGSGSTGVAAHRLGFDFIGIELSPDYLELARARIETDAPLLFQEQLTEQQPAPSPQLALWEGEA